MKIQLLEKLLLFIGIAWSLHLLSIPFPLVITLDKGGGKEMLQAALANPGAVLGILSDAIEENLPVITSTPLLFGLVLASKQPPSQPYPFLKEKISDELWQQKLDEQREFREQWFKRNILVRLEDKDRWIVYLNKDDDLALLLPTSYSKCVPGRKKDIYKPDLYQLGFEQDYLKELQAKQIRTIFSHEDYLTKPVNVEHLGKLFRKFPLRYRHPKEPFEHYIVERIAELSGQPKNVLLMGHGLAPELKPEVVAQIAGMSVEEYKFFLCLLNDINTKFLYVISCFAGGSNLIKMHKNVIERHSATAKGRELMTGIDYPIVIGSTFDMPSIYITPKSEPKPYLQEFFTRLGVWEKDNLGIKRFYLKKIKGQRYSLAEVVFPIYNRHRYPGNIPSIFFPGMSLSFRVINLPDLFIITYTSLQKYIFEQKFIQAVMKTHPELIKKKPPLLKSFLPIEGVTNVLIYPAIIDASLRLLFDKYLMTAPFFISKIAGQSMHIIKQLEASSQDLFSLLAYGFWVGGTKGPIGSNTGWFINRLYCNNLYESLPGLPREKLIIIGVAILFGISEDIIILRLLNTNKYYLSKVQGTPATATALAQKKLINTPQKLPFEEITLEQYERIVRDIYAQTKPEADALHEATGGFESLEMLEQAFTDFLRTASSQLTLVEDIIKNLLAGDEGQQEYALVLGTSWIEHGLDEDLISQLKQSAKKLLIGTSSQRDIAISLYEGLIKNQKDSLVAEDSAYFINQEGQIAQEIGIKLCEKLIEKGYSKRYQELINKALKLAYKHPDLSKVQSFFKICISNGLYDKVIPYIREKFAKYKELTPSARLILQLCQEFIKYAPIEQAKEFLSERISDIRALLADNQKYSAACELLKASIRKGIYTYVEEMLPDLVKSTNRWEKQSGDELLWALLDAQKYTVPLDIINELMQKAQEESDYIRAYKYLLTLVNKYPSAPPVLDFFKENREAITNILNRLKEKIPQGQMEKIQVLLTK